MTGTTSAEEMLRRADDALKRGRISPAEHDYFVKHIGGVDHIRDASEQRPQSGQRPLSEQRPQRRLQRRHGIAVSTAIIVVIAIGIIWALLNGATTPGGFAIIDIPHGSVTAASIPINTVVTGLNVTGTLYGEGNATIILSTDHGDLLVAQIVSDDGTPRTQQPSYLPGDNVSIEHMPENASAYLDNGTQNALVSVPFSAPAGNSTLLIVANESGALATYRVPIVIGNAERERQFTQVCVETCAMDATNGTLDIITTGTANVSISSLDAQTTQPDRPPELVVPFDTIVVMNETAVNLSAHFTDPDGDPLLYSAGPSDLVNATVDGDMLTLYPVAGGNGTLLVYASDLKDLASATLQMHVELPQASVANETMTNETNATAAPTAQTNTTMNATNASTTATPPTNTTNETNTTTGETNATTNGTTNGTGNATPIVPPTDLTNGTNATAPLDCSNPDPNQRPISCMYQNATSLFPDQEILLYNLDRAAVARFTPIGNLMLSGKVVQQSTGSPGARDYRIGYVDADGNSVATIWIDTATGDLHLRGSLYEENANLQPPAGSVSLSNKRSVFLAWADPQRGDLYIRGNVIPYRADFMS